VKLLSLVRTMIALLALASCAYAQDGFLTSWEDRVRTTLAEQPAWPTPLVTANSGLVQLFRTDFVRQITPTEVTTWNFGNSKGLDLIPWYKTEFDITVPPYIQHNSPAINDGFGDLSMLLKYRILSDNETHPYSISASLGGTIPTGSYTNGSLAGTISPTLYGGKGFRKVDVQSAVGMALPTGFTSKLGRPLTWNSVAQYKIGKLFWPEIENNATYFHGGPHDGKTQDFVTPGLMLSRFKLEHDARNRLSLTFGAGEQIAVSHYHGYNHGLIFTSRLAF
jgi:Putative MetA-pathway of phenol degradation